jgi:hypothetical protein
MPLCNYVLQEKVPFNFAYLLTYFEKRLGERLKPPKIPGKNRAVRVIGFG